MPCKVGPPPLRSQTRALQPRLGPSLWGYSTDSWQALASGSGAESRDQLCSSSSRLKGLKDEAQAVASHPLPLKVTTNQTQIQLKSPSFMFPLRRTKQRWPVLAGNTTQPCIVLGDKWRVKKRLKIEVMTAMKLFIHGKVLWTVTAVQQ